VVNSGDVLCIKSPGIFHDIGITSNSLGAGRQKNDNDLAKDLRLKYDLGKYDTHERHVCRLAAGAFKRDAIPGSAGTVKKSTLFRKSTISLKNR
jgi:hypothetical protein